MAETKLGNFDIQYDPSADVLYCSFGPPQDAIGEEFKEGVIIRRNPETNAVVGITIIDFCKSFVSRPGNTVSVPLDRPTEAVA